MPSLEYILNQKIFFKDDSIYFDLTHSQRIVVVRFVFGLESEKIDFLQNATKLSEYSDTNFVLIYGGNDRHEYRGNLDGLPELDLWNDPLYIGTFLHELLYVRNKMRYVTTVANCSGAWTALLASVRVHFHSMLLVSPVISQAPKELFDDSTSSLILSWSTRKNIVEKVSEKHKQFLDLFPVC